MGKRNKGVYNGANSKAATAAFNTATFYRQYYDRLMELSMVMFEWKNMPDTVDIRYLERCLFLQGKAVFFEDPVLGHLALKCATDGGFNVYGVPTSRRAYADNGYSANLTDKDSVIIWNNYSRTNSVTDVQIFARRLANIDATIDINLRAQKTPILIRCSEQQRLTLLNMYAQYSGDEPCIFGDDKLDLNQMTVFTTGAPYVADKIREEKNQTWNEVLTYFGISNTNITKRERMVTDEVIRAQGGTIASRYSRLEMRRAACKQINELFGLNVECDYREDFREVTDDIFYEGDTGGEGIAGTTHLPYHKPRGGDK